MAPPADLAVSFSRLPSGTYPVHVHSRCNGNQAFHIVVVESLRITSGGSGSIEVPRGYFGRGLCLIVYSNPALSAVLTTRPI
jgi:putative transposon-encoded protein